MPPDRRTAVLRGDDLRRPRRGGRLGDGTTGPCRGRPTSRSIAPTTAASASARTAERVITEPFDVFDAGRMAIVRRPRGRRVRVWQAGTHIGAEMVNAPGSWNCQHLIPATSKRRSASTARSSAGSSTRSTSAAGRSAMVACPGYSDYLESIDPGVRKRHADGRRAARLQRRDRLVHPARTTTARTLECHLHRRRTPTRRPPDPRARRPGPVEPFDVPWPRVTSIRDPQGATFTLSQFKPPEE